VQHYRRVHFKTEIKKSNITIQEPLTVLKENAKEGEHPVPMQQSKE
jgi:hypothetical protein